MPKVSKINQLKAFRTDAFNFEKEQPKPKTEYFWYPKYTEQLIKLKLTPVRTTEDASLNLFLSSVADSENFSKSIVHCVRIRALDKLSKSHEKKEYLITYENWKGYDKSGHLLPSVSDYPAGTIDKQVLTSTEYNSDGTSYQKIQEEFNIYTLEFSPKALDEALESCSATQLESVQFSVLGIGRTYSGYNIEEFRNLSYQELVERGRLGTVNGPVDKEILELDKQMAELRDRKKKERATSLLKKGTKK